jgi:hypothetical protein
MIGPSDERPKEGPGAFQDVVTLEVSDVDRGLCALLRQTTAGGDASRLGLVWFGSESVASDLGVTLETVQPLERWQCRFEDEGMALGVELQAVSPPIDFDDPATEALTQAAGLHRYEQLCRVRGELRAAGRVVQIDGVGRRSHAWGDPSGARVRSLYAIAGDRSVTLTAVQPSEGAPHGRELVAAHLLRSESPPEVLAAARLSTIYDAGGRPRTAGAELYVEGEEYPRRISGEAICRAQDQRAHIRAACFRWSVDGEPGQGGYQLISR